MNFKLTPNPTFNVDVQLSVPGAVATVPMTFKYQDKNQLDAWFEKNKSRKTAEALTEIVVSWAVLDDADQPLPVTLDTMNQLFTNYPAAPNEILTAYYNGLVGSRAKN